MRRWLQMGLGLLAAATLSASALPGAAMAAGKPSPFANWAAVVVAGDYHAAHDSEETEAFDNARRDVTTALSTEMGFQPGNVRQFSVRPGRYPDTRPGSSTVFNIYDNLKELAGQAKGGCLFYYTSHGAPEGAYLGSEDPDGATLIFPTELTELIERACPKRPVIVVISTCFSAVNIPAMSKPNWMVMTAARKDRTSFGCSARDTYPYFDACFLSQLKAAKNFAVLAPAVKACIGQKEIDTGMRPPAEPQTYIGGAMLPLLPLMPFPHGG
ncbi:hypothetical protein QO010_001391 [Caulobacter ginsengisoli]|uniref:Peptidase C13 n=1 Tax=Caulobacter ginsengisoli TaxID=400775 RepID=A0ABU0IQE5_9CAUL|nr:C13 family peptidase [Caulobacter ginsengisoli]MDQ0463620.1 hypothetical protein [Caulobacter ginsengisoli]